jgi:phosphocarrier protein
MIETKITIINKLGLHARAASKFVSTASAFGCEIKVGKEGASGQLVDGKSIMSVMMLAASKGTELTLSFDGHDQQAALQAVTGLINDYFEEGE